MKTNHLFLDVSEINNYEQIISEIINDPNFEHIYDVEAYIADIDKKRDLNSLEHKRAVFTIIKGLLDTSLIEVDIQFIRPKHVQNPKTEEELFAYLDEYWDKVDENIRGYLVFFENKKQV